MVSLGGGRGGGRRHLLASAQLVLLSRGPRERVGRIGLRELAAVVLSVLDRGLVF